MRLFRIILPLLLAAALPCAAQSLPPKLSSQSTMTTPEANSPPGQGLPCVLAIAPGAAVPSKAMQMKLCSRSTKQMPSAIKVLIPGKDSACYSIRDYRFEAPKDSQVPKLKSYSTCVPAARFEARNVITPRKR
jgi:hypothetical protein